MAIVTQTDKRTGITYAYETQYHWDKEKKQSRSKRVVEKEGLVLVEEPEQAVEIREKVQLPKKPEEPLLLSKYPVIMELDAELNRRNKEIFAVEQERSNLEIELPECTGVFKKKQRKELQAKIC